mgnify:CR=1 FL=1
MVGRVNELLAELRVCGETLSCCGCKRVNSPVLCQSLVAEAADMLQEYVDRCARYAEETMELREKQQWISVTERLPKDEKPVLTFVGYADTMHGFITVSTYFALDPSPHWQWDGLVADRAQKTLYWMPLPPAPEVNCDG